MYGDKKIIVPVVALILILFLAMVFSPVDSKIDENTTPPDLNDSITATPSVETPTETGREDLIYDVLRTDPDYSDLVDMVGDITLFTPTKTYPLDATNVADGSTYLEGKLRDYKSYVPYLQKLPLNENTVLVRFERPDAPNGTVFYSVIDEKSKKSMQLILFLSITLTPEVSI